MKNLLHTYLWWRICYRLTYDKEYATYTLIYDEEFVMTTSWNFSFSEHCFGTGSGLDSESIGSADPDPGRSKLFPQKEKNAEISCFVSLNVLCRGLRRHISWIMTHDGFDQKKFQFKNVTIIVIISLGLDPHPDWIRIQQQAGSGFSKISRSSVFGSVNTSTEPKQCSVGRSIFRL
jgi:hypothetical protein